MILETLINQFVQRFQHEKRAQVCLWFDERQEFERVMPALRAHLESMKEPPFSLFEYDASRNRGQVWLKYQIHRALEAADQNTRKRLRFVLYLPLSEDRLEKPGPNGEPPLDLLIEYYIGGLTWRVGGKRPTLFTFLRQAEVALTDNPSEQRRLYEGGCDSLLAKYVAKFVNRPPVFWKTTLTPELAQSQLVGDLDQTLLDMGLDPDGTWKELRDKGLDIEFLDLVNERYGFALSMDSPAHWMEEFVAVLALTETYIGYREPTDFPFLERLPPHHFRAHYIRLLNRWLRDSQGRTAWDNLIREVEARIDLTEWAKGREGLSFALPRLVRQRWEEIWSAFEEAAGKISTTATFFERCNDLIEKEAEYSRVSGTPIGAWDLLWEVYVFVNACDEAEKRAEQSESLDGLARVYVEFASRVELEHIRIRYEAEEQGLPAIGRVVDRAYASYTNTLNGRFFHRLPLNDTVSIPGFKPVTPRLTETIWKANGKRAVIIVDALRYDCGLAIQMQLRERSVEVEPIVAVLPTITPVGMTAIMPLEEAQLGLRIQGNSVQPIVNGKDMSARANRLAFLRESGSDCREIGDIETQSEPPKGLGELLVVFGHEEVDHIGHGDAQNLIRHVHLEIDRLARLIRKLHRWGFPQVHVVTDHGFILLDEEKLPEEVKCEKDWCHLLKERFALVPAHADLPVATFAFAWDTSTRVAVPPGLSFFKAEKSFSHGGAAVQELIIPHVISKSHVIQEKRIGVEVVLPTYALMRTAVKVTLRPVSVAEPTQMALFAETGRVLALDVKQNDDTGEKSSVLAGGPKEVQLGAKDKEQNVTLFFHTAAVFRRGDLLDLEIRDVETDEQFPPGGIKLTVGRDM